MRAKILLYAVTLAMFTVAFNTTALLNAIVVIENDFDLTDSALEWIMNSYLLTAASFIILGGRISDSLGRIQSFLIGICVFIAGSTCIALSMHFYTLLIGRILQGLGAACVIPCSLALGKATMKENNSTMAVCVWTAGIALGLSTGPIISGLITVLWSWQYIFWLTIVFLLISGFITLFYWRSYSQSQNRFRLDWIGLILFALGIFLTILGLIQGNLWGWFSIATLGSIIFGLCLLTGFILYERQTPLPLLNIYLFKRRIFLLSNIGSGMSIFSLFSILYFFNLFIQNPSILAFSPLIAAFALLPFSIMLLITSLSTHKIAKWCGIRLITSLGLLIISISFFLLNHLSQDMSYKMFIFPLLMMGFGLGMSFSSFQSIEMNSVPSEQYGEASGILNTINLISGSLAISIGSIFFITSGKRALTKAFATMNLSQQNVYDLISALPENQIRIRTVFDQIGPDLQLLTQKALQQSALLSFTQVMLVGGFVTLIGAVCNYILIKEDHFI